MNVCKRVLFQGHVQGVGFRYATHGLAQRFAVAGYVRNLADGRVELVAEGLEAKRQKEKAFFELAGATSLALGSKVDISGHGPAAHQCG